MPNGGICPSTWLPARDPELCLRVLDMVNKIKSIEKSRVSHCHDFVLFPHIQGLLTQNKHMKMNGYSGVSENSCFSIGRVAFEQYPHHSTMGTMLDSGTFFSSHHLYPLASIQS